MSTVPVTWAILTTKHLIIKVINMSNVTQRELEQEIRSNLDAEYLATNPTIFAEVKRVKLDRQGYDENGRYYGVGEPLYSVYFETMNEKRTQLIYSGGGRFRAQNYKYARKLVKSLPFTMKVDR